MRNRLQLLLLSLLGAMALTTGPPVLVSPDRGDGEELLRMVRDRAQEMRQITSEPRFVYSWIALLCDRAGLTEEDYRLEKANRHNHKFVRVYVTPEGHAAATGHEAVHPVGTVVLKEKLPALPGDPKTQPEGVPGAISELFTGMVKREPGYNPFAGDWEFFTVSGEGTKITSRGRLATCMECHSRWDEQDFVSRQYIGYLVEALSPGADGVIRFPAKDAQVFGKSVRYDNKADSLTGWTPAEDRCEWRFNCTGGAYEVDVLLAGGSGSGGAEVEVLLDETMIAFRVEPTGATDQFQTQRAGRFRMREGWYTLTLRMRVKPGAAVMNLRSVTLRPAEH